MLRLFKSSLVFFVTAISSCQSVQEKLGEEIDSFSIRGGKVYDSNGEEQREATKVEIKQLRLDNVLNADKHNSTTPPPEKSKGASLKKSKGVSPII